MDAKEIAKKWLPPALLEHLKPLLKRGIYFAGNYPNWSAANDLASGYDAELILERVKQALLKVRNGEAVFERDSVLFDEVQYSFPVLAALLRVAAENENRLSVLDFGGSLGSSYFQCRDFLSVLSSLHWSVVEQEHFVRCGRESFEDEQLRFYFTIKDCMSEATPNVALLSSVLQYLPDPYEVLEELMESNVQYLVIDRTPFADCEADRISIQHVPSSIYLASYPCRIFSRQSFLTRMKTCYDLVAQFESGDASARVGNLQFSFNGMVLRKR